MLESKEVLRMMKTCQKDKAPTWRGSLLAKSEQVGLLNKKKNVRNRFLLNKVTIYESLMIRKNSKFLGGWQDKGKRPSVSRVANCAKINNWSNKWNIVIPWNPRVWDPTDTKILNKV